MGAPRSQQPTKDRTMKTTVKLHPGQPFNAEVSSFAMLYGMDIPTMQRLGLYISEPRSAQETDHRFPEPGLLVVNMEGILQVVDVANAPFVRPDLDTLLLGLSFVIEKNYPTRG